jgi:ribosomal protein L37AE/L43A
MTTKVGPLMARFNVDGHSVLLPADAKFYPRLRPDLPLCPVCMGAGGSEPGEPIWICGECGGCGQLEYGP